MAHTQFEPRNRTIEVSDLIALIPVVLLVAWVVLRSLV
jgi:hypothetical protein